MCLRALTVLMILASLSCESERDKNHDKSLLLTANVWNLQQEERVPMTGAWSFKMDGHYVDDVRLKEAKSPGYVVGEWEWRNRDEIILRQVQILKHGKTHDIGEDNFYIFKITKLTKENLEGIIRNSADSTRGLFARRMVFSVQKDSGIN